VARTPLRSTSTAHFLGHGRLVELSADVLNVYKSLSQSQLTQSRLICIAIAVRTLLNPDIPVDIVHDNCVRASFLQFSTHSATASPLLADEEIHKMQLL
jgi:hypothetical protein